MPPIDTTFRHKPSNSNTSDICEDFEGKSDTKITF